MKLLLLFFLSYYSTCQGLSDSTLKSNLAVVIQSDTRYTYGTNEYHKSDNLPQWQKGDLKSYGTWYAFPVTDVTEDGIVWDMYSNATRYFPNKQGDSGCGLNIEHCLPKSWWGAEAACTIAYQDLFNLNPSDAQANSQKSNYPPGHVQTGDKFDNGSFRMDSKNTSQYGWACFEPEEQYRGDFARAYFYIATAYGDSVQWGDSYSDYVTNDSYLEFTDTIIEVLLAWHRADPVSPKEAHRAAVITSIQHNHNPFIDYPDLVEYIWGDRKGQTVDFDALTCYFNEADTLSPHIARLDLSGMDTLIYLPAVTKNMVNALPNGYASDKIGSIGAGTAAMTMGTGATDGWISFNGLNLTDTAMLIFRASPFQTAEAMQLDIYDGDSLLVSFTDSVINKTRHEKYYHVTLPVGLDSLTIISVGGATTQRASMQELYILHEAPEVPEEPVGPEDPEDPEEPDEPQNPEDPEEPETALHDIEHIDAPVTFIHNGQIYIRRQGTTYSIYGTKVN